MSKPISGEGGLNTFLGIRVSAALDFTIATGYLRSTLKHVSLTTVFGVVI
jgi:hypothetical protein